MINHNQSIIHVVCFLPTTDQILPAAAGAAISCIKSRRQVFYLASSAIMLEYPLPNELIECILDNLYSDRDTLLNCALVGRAWVTTSQKGIFQRIVLDAPNSHHEDYVQLTHDFLAANERLVDLFDDKPHLTKFVKTLELRQYEKPSRTRDARELQQALQISTANVIRRLSDITNLSIFRLTWSNLNDTLKDALVQAFSAPLLTRVSLSLVAIPTFAELASLLTRVKLLKVLKITFLACHNWDIPPPAAPAENCVPPRSIHLNELVHFHLVNIRAFTAWFMQDYCPFELSNLQTLELHRSATFDYQGTAFMLEYIGANLKELELQGPYRNHPDFNVVHFGYTPNLESVRLISVQQTDSLSPVPFIQSLFEPLLNPSRNKFSLKRLTIDLNIDHVDPMDAHHQWDMWMLLINCLPNQSFRYWRM
ncbi:hypothetical protein D9757_003771 [Collybiopsis confluens]|uniref:F-box domain-containing protein n=1 Tax=Collybiopsis confluens TaxID=2823264 RepID=A0A8H5HV49_9AGAR|nr:hypothetical protein D9757_003771 [Collybiopsis confluens]